MVFSSAVFLFLFLPAALLVYAITPARLKNAFLLLASLFFYSWGEPANVFVMLGAILLNYACALLMHAFREKKRIQTAVFLTGLLATVGLLFAFKYRDFAVTNCNALFHTDFPLQNRALPIGISFFTFQMLSYLIEVKQGSVPVQKNPLSLGLYISFFPQLIAGPIVRYTDVHEQLQKRTVTATSFSTGCIRFMTGFSKKLLIADQLAPYVDDIFARHGCSAPLAWLGIIAYTLQIYFDFSGYSDMAIGLGKLFGFDFPENFNYPYTAASVKEFWKRWHISLSQWFRDYVYIPLGGNRRSRARVLMNLCIVWALTGFWHGASWNFIVWGLYYCAFLIAERSAWGKLLAKAPAVLRHAYTILVFLFGWIFFREDGLANACLYIQHLFTCTETAWIDFISVVDRKLVFCTVSGIIFATPVVPFLQKTYGSRAAAVSTAAAFLLFLIAIAFLLGTGFSPFLYFQF